MGRSQSFGKGLGRLEESKLSWHNPSAAAKPRGDQGPLGDASAATGQVSLVTKAMAASRGPCCVERKEKKSLCFIDHSGSLLRRQPGACCVDAVQVRWKVFGQRAEGIIKGSPLGNC